MSDKLTHFNEEGHAIMVDVTDKVATQREAVAKGKIVVSQEIIDRIKNNEIEKGDVLGIARIAGIMAVKKTSELIPLCHPLFISKCAIDFEINEAGSYIEASCTVKVDQKTGVEMEALTGVNIALLTIYDMCKAIDKKMELTDIRLCYKSGGKSGVFVNEERS